MSRIQLETDAARAIKDRLASLNQQQYDLFGKLNGYIAGAEGAWSGELADAFKARVASVSPDAGAITQMLNDYTGALEFAVQEIEAADRKLSIDASAFGENGKAQVDSFTFNGHTVPAYADKRLYDKYYRQGQIFMDDYQRNGARYNNCAEYVNRFYREVFGVDLSLGWGAAPKIVSGTGTVIAVTVPQPGDIVFFGNHWAIVRSVGNDGMITVIEQNWFNKLGKTLETIVNRSVQASTGKYYRVAQ